METEFVMDVSSATFEQEVVEASKQVPVLVDFWAPWCGPCRALGPVLEKLAHEYAGRFRLVKVNSDENPELSQRFKVRSIPAVHAFRDGRHAGQFLGALPEREVRSFIDSIAPAPAEEQRVLAAALRGAGDAVGAIGALRKAVELDPSHELARIDLAELLLGTGQYEDAARELEHVQPNIDWDIRVEALKQGIAFARVGGNEKDLQARVAANPADLETRLALAGALAARKSWREAMDQLLEIVRRNKGWRDGEARKQMLAIFNLAADQSDLVSEYRRKLSSALH